MGDLTNSDTVLVPRYQKSKKVAARPVKTSGKAIKKPVRYLPEGSQCKSNQMSADQFREYMAKRSAPKQIETGIQQGCIKWFDVTYPDLSLLLFAVPNGGKRNIATAARLKKEGVRSGVPDLFLSIPCGLVHGFYLECKAPGRYMSKEQREFSTRVRELGYMHSVFTSLDEFMTLINNYLTVKNQLK